LESQGDEFQMCSGFVRGAETLVDENVLRTDDKGEQIISRGLYVRITDWTVRVLWGLQTYEIQEPEVPAVLKVA
jgi:hypothetical protein